MLSTLEENLLNVDESISSKRQKVNVISHHNSSLYSNMIIRDQNGKPMNSYPGEWAWAHRLSSFSGSLFSSSAWQLKEIERASFNFKQYYIGPLTMLMLRPRQQNHAETTNSFDEQMLNNANMCKTICEQRLHFVIINKTGSNVWNSLWTSSKITNPQCNALSLDRATSA